MSKFNQSRWDELVIKEASSAISSEELVELNEMDKHRDSYLFAQEFAKTRTNAENALINKAVELYNNNQFESWENQLADLTKNVIDERKERE